MCGHSCWGVTLTSGEHRGLVWLARCELFVRKGESGRGREGDEAGVSLSCLPVWLLLVTLLDEIRGDRLSALHVSLSPLRSPSLLPERLKRN